MWQSNVVDDPGSTLKKKVSSGGSFLTFQQWTALISGSDDFVIFYNDLLKSAGFEGFFWEVKPVNQERWNSEFEFVQVESEAVARITPNSKAFTEHFHTKEPAVSFDNLEGDAKLIVPTPISNHLTYGHLGSFIRNASTEQILAFWKLVGTAYENKLSESPMWLSTAGMGVPWLHVRIDSRPKYYRYSPYKAW